MDIVENTRVVTAVADQVWQRLLVRQAVYALFAGGRVESLPRGTLAEAEDDARAARAAIQQLEGVEANALEPCERKLLGYLRYFLKQQSRADESWWWAFPVAPYQVGLAVGLYTDQLFGRFQFREPDDADCYLALVGDLAAWVRAMPAKLAAQADRGWGLPAPALAGFEAAVAGARSALDTAVRLSQTTPEQSRNLAARVDALVDDELLPAFDEVAAYLQGPGRDSAVAGVGLGQYPGGDDAYRTLVSDTATYTIDPAALHATGLQDVDELTEQMAAVRGSVGFEGSEDAYRAVLQSDPRFYATSPAAVAATYQRHLATIEPVIDRWFSRRPAAAYGVERLGAGSEAGMSYGYYATPTAQQPIGRYRFNGSGLDTRSQLNAAALIFHELVPGHHFHLASQAEDESLHALRAHAAPLTLGAYTEGWAEYAASLGFEMGLYEDPFDRYGALMHQRFIAQRLVVDTGLNALGWSLEQARDYMTRMTLESTEQVRTETLRYSTDMPAQALGYRTGWRAFWQLRRRAEDALGPDFDVRRYHEVVLGGGTLPLPSVAANVDAWINSVQGPGGQP